MPMLILEGKSWWESFSSFLSSFLFLSYFFSLLCKYVKSIQKVNSFHFVFGKGYFHCNRPITIHVTDRLYQLYPWRTYAMGLSSIPLRLQMLITAHVQAANFLIKQMLWWHHGSRGKEGTAILCVSYHEQCANCPMIGCKRCQTLAYFSSQLQSAISSEIPGFIKFLPSPILVLSGNWRTRNSRSSVQFHTGILRIHVILVQCGTVSPPSVL